MFNKLMQPSPSLHYHHPVITLLRKTLEAGVPRTDFLDRFKTASEIMDNIEKYVVTDKHPRWLFLNQGELAMDKAWATHDALTLAPTDKVNFLKGTGLDPEANPDDVLKTETKNDLITARVAFENALYTDTSAPLVEPSSDMEPLTRLGDALLSAGDISGAQDTYARAVNSFIEDYEPPGQIVLLARAVAHWATLRVALGACYPNATPDEAWEKRWRLLGTGTNDVCAFGRPEIKESRPSLLGIIRPFVADAINNCAKPLPWREAKASEVPRHEPNETFKMIDCLRVHGPDDPNVLKKFEDDHVGAIMETDIENALSAPPRN